MFRDLQKTQTVFTGIAAHVGFGANLAYDAQTLSGEGLLVSGSYFPVLHLQPALGRLLGSNDDRVAGESRVVVLSYNYWSSRLGPERDGEDSGLLRERRMSAGFLASPFAGTVRQRRRLDLSRLV